MNSSTQQLFSFPSKRNPQPMEWHCLHLVWVIPPPPNLNKSQRTVSTTILSSINLKRFANTGWCVQSLNKKLSLVSLWVTSVSCHISSILVPSACLSHLHLITLLYHDLMKPWWKEEHWMRVIKKKKKMSHQRPRQGYSCAFYCESDTQVEIGEIKPG